MCGENNNQECCLHDLLNSILLLQNRDTDCDQREGCDKPFLGPTPNCVCYNTRPISLYNCQTGELWNINYNTNGRTGTSTVFRIENLDNCCCTCRILIPKETTNETETISNKEDEYIPTRQFFTIDLNCVSAVQCHPDVFLDLC